MIYFLNELINYVLLISIVSGPVHLHLFWVQTFNSLCLLDLILGNCALKLGNSISLFVHGVLELFHHKVLLCWRFLEPLSVQIHGDFVSFCFMIIPVFIQAKPVLFISFVELFKTNFLWFLPLKLFPLNFSVSIDNIVLFFKTFFPYWPNWLIIVLILA